jgi:hypothetical protein
VYSYTGFCSYEVPPSPNTHVHDVGVLVDVSLNWTANGAIPYVKFAVNEVTGSTSVTVIYAVSETVSLPAELVDVRVTVKDPDAV